MLTPGASPNIESFARSLPNSVYYSVQLIGKTGTARLLKDLVSRSVGKIKAQACLELAGRFPGQEDCLRDLLRKANRDVHVIPLAKKQLTTSLSRDAAIKKGLRKDPRNWLEGHARSHELEDIRDELSLLAMHADPEIRRVACGLLDHEFPGHGDPDCQKTR
jgi:hypothetical protein